MPAAVKYNNLAPVPSTGPEWFCRRCNRHGKSETCDRCKTAEHTIVTGGMFRAGKLRSERAATQ